MTKDSLHWDLLSKSIPKLTKENLENFRSENTKRRLSFGLDDIGNNNYFNYLVEELLNYFDLNLIQNSIGSTKGNPRIITNKEYNITTTFNDLFLIGYFLKLKPFIEENDILIEIGGGYGGLAEKIIKSCHFKSYYIFDIETSIYFQSYYLSEYLKNYPKKIFLKNCNKFEITIKEIYEKELNKRIIFINTRSFMEMTKKTIKNYFDNIQKYSKKGDLFFNANRYQKSISGEVIKIRKYPYDNKWSLVSVNNSIGQPYILELLTIRREKEDKNNTFLEFLKALKEPNNFKIQENKILQIKVLLKYKVRKYFNWINKFLN